MEIWNAPFGDGWDPKLSPDGKLCVMGAGHGRIINVATKATVVMLEDGFRSGGWLNNDQCVVYGDRTGTDKVWRTYRLDAPSFNNPVDLGPAYNFAGVGGNVWAGGNGTSIFCGDKDGNAVKIADGYSATVDENGTVEYSIDVHTSPKLVVWKNGQILRTIIPARAPNRQIIGAGYVGYGYSGPSWINTPDNQNVQVNLVNGGNESPPLAFMHQGAVWIATTNDNGVYLRPFGEREKAIIISIPFHDPYGGAVSCSVVSRGDTIVSVSNDAKGKLTVALVPADTQLQSLTAPKPDVDKFANPLWVGCFFKDSVRYGSDPAAPGSCSVIAEEGLAPKGPVVILRRLISEYANRWNQVNAVYVTSEDGNLEVEANRAKDEMSRLKLTKRPVLSYTGPNVIKSTEVDVVGIECYQGRETLTNAVNRWKSQASQVAGKVALICGAYDRAGMLTEDQILAAQPKYADIARSLGTKCWGLLYFSWKRPGGAYEYPSVQEWIRAVDDAATKPTIVQERPRITITSYGPRIIRVGQKCRAVRALSGGKADKVIWRYRRRGTSTWIVAAINSPTDDDHSFKWDKAGDYEIGVKVEGPGGTDATGSLRIVTVT